MKAIPDAVSEEAIAKALNVSSPKTIRGSRARLTDISADALETLKDKPVAGVALRILIEASCATSSATS